MVGFEPRAPTYSLVARAPEARGVARLSHTLIIEERLVRLNSRFLHGKQMGYHYTMAPCCWLNQIVKDQGTE